MSVERFTELCRENIRKLMARAADGNQPSDERARARRQIRIWEKHFAKARRLRVPPAEG